MNLVKKIEAGQMKDNITDFRVGDTIKVYFKIVEGKTERIQIFEGVCICKRGEGISKSFTIRKMSYGVGVERIFPLHSPKIAKLEVVRHGKVRRAKLYFLRERSGKAAKIKELLGVKKQKIQVPETGE